MTRLAWTIILPFMLLHVAGMTGECQHTKSLVEMGILWTFDPDSPGTMIFQVSASWVARIIEMSQYTRPY
jgi:hypothetical protein